MERKFYNDNFERLLKEKSDEFRMYPSKRVWHSINNDLHPGRKWPSVAMSMLLIIALLLIGYFNTNDNNSGKTNSVTKNVVGLPTSEIDHKQSAIADNTVNKNNSSSTLEISNNDKDTDPAGLQTNKSSSASTTDNHNNSNVASNSRVPLTNTSGLIASIDNYIKTNQLFSDLSTITEKNQLKKISPVFVNSGNNNVTDESPNPVNKLAIQNRTANIPVNNDNINTKEENKSSTTGLNPTAKTSPGLNKKTVSNDDKAWMEDYALHNKSERRKWKDRVAMELYATPSIGYRNLGSNLKNDAATAALTSSTAAPTANKTMSQKPSLGLEAGIGFSYSVAKKIRLKGGIQLNYTSYGINADENNHPVLTTLLLNDPKTGHTFLSARTSTLSNSSGVNPVTVHNKTYQVSVPVGIALKLAGNNKLEWYVGASLQPTFVFGASTHFISSDYNNYVSDPSLLRKWNMNTGFETYMNYKLGGYSLQVGPQFRYQLLSTYNKKSTTTENLYNMGLKVGLIKGF